MKPMRFSIARLMIVIAVVGLNIGVARMVWVYMPALVIQVGTPCLLMEWGIYSAMRSQGRFRAFWAGYVLLALLSMASFVWAGFTPENVEVDPTSGRIVVTSTGSISYRIWSCYLELTSKPILSRLPESMVTFSEIGDEYYSAPLNAISVMLFFTPQFLISLAGGLAAWGLFRAYETRSQAHDLESPQPNPVA